MRSASVQIVYRLAPERPGKLRPRFFSQGVALLSLLRAAERVGDRAKLHFICDGDVDQATLDIASQCGTAERVSSNSNSASLLRAIDKALEISDQDLVYLAEDDYIYREEALEALLEAASALPQVEYFTLYDHPDRYTRGDDAPAGQRVILAGDRHWQAVESTCFTFAARVERLRADRWVFELGAARTPPLDREVWRGVLLARLWYLLGWATRQKPSLAVRTLVRREVWSRCKRSLAGRSPALISPIPSLATHAASGFLAPAVDWPAEVESIFAWAADRPDLSALLEG